MKHEEYKEYRANDGAEEVRAEPDRNRLMQELDMFQSMKAARDEAAAQLNKIEVAMHELENRIKDDVRHLSRMDPTVAMLARLIEESQSSISTTMAEDLIDLNRAYATAIKISGTAGYKENTL